MMMMKGSNLVALVAVLLAEVVCLALAQEEPRPSFSIPNPFKDIEHRRQQDVRNIGDFYSISSTQTVLSSHKKSKKTKVQEYFSLSSGLSVSIHKEQEKDGESWALISDGPNGKSYIVRNPEETEKDYIDCELDHSHEHRHVFPWQYEFDLRPASVEVAEAAAEAAMGILPAIESGQLKRKRKKSKKNNNNNNNNAKPARVAIYGLGAIWLNAIDKNLQSDLIGQNSPYAESNSWHMEEDDLKVEFLFDKLKNGEDLQGLSQQHLDETLLVSVHIKRNNLIEKAHDDPSGLSSAGLQDEFIVVDKFESGLKSDQVQALKLMQVQLSSCRRHNKRHRVFPSLLREMSQSPQRMFNLQYIERKYARFESLYANKQPHHMSSGEFDETRHRYVFPEEFVTEIFSLKAETQVNIYDALPVDGVGPGYGRTDVFMKKFTENSGQVRSSRHSTVHYHLIENESGEIVGCKVGEMEPMPKEHIFTRPVYFHRPNGVRLSGHLTGLGALLLNVADIHYKSFNLFRRNINVNQNPYRLDVMRRLKVDEWRVEDKRSGWRIHLFFERINSSDRAERHFMSTEVDLEGDEDNKLRQEPSLTALGRGDISRLVRVDIRDTRAQDTSDSVIEDSGEDRRDDYDLVAQFDIVKLDFALDEQTFDQMTSVPVGVCTGEEHDDSSSDSGDYYFDDDHYNNFHGSDDSDNESVNQDDTKHWIDQWQGEGFEEGDLNEDFDLPNLFELTDGQPAYEIGSRLEIIPNEEDDDQAYDETRKAKQTPSTKYIWMRELVDLEQEISTIQLYKTLAEFNRNEPFERYFINYNSELVFHITKSKCRYLENVDDTKWLRLFSKKLLYSVTPNLKVNNELNAADVNQPVIIQSNKLRLYGLGALWQRSIESQYTEFLGRRKKVVVVDEKDSSVKYHQLVWSDEDHSELRILYNFLRKIDNNQEKQQHSSPGEKLHLDSINVLNTFGDYYVTSFKSINVKILSLEGRESKKLYIPGDCQDIMIEMRRLKGNDLTLVDIQAPTFADLIQETDSYAATYSVSHKVQITDSQQDGSRSYVHEHYDHKQNRGKIVVRNAENKIETQVFIEGGDTKKMFSYSEELNLCKQITQLKALVDLGPMLDTADSAVFDFDKKFGLAALWTALAQQKFALRIEDRFDSRGHKYQVRTYEFIVQLAKEMNSRMLQVNLEFRSTIKLSSTTWKPGDIKQRQENAMSLKQISISSVAAEKGAGKLRDNYVTNIYVLELGKLHSRWELPEACKKLMGSSSSSGPPADTKEGVTNKEDKKPAEPSGEEPWFPKISHLLSSIEQLHMKSEISRRDLDLKDSTKFYMLDEWTHNNHLRVKLTGLGARSKYRDFDFILYSATKEVFDISTPYQCPSSLPNAGLATDVASNLVAFWSNESPLINHLSHLFYGPISLWLLAEKNPQNVRLSSSMNIAPMPSVGANGVDRSDRKDALAKYEREMKTETWEAKLPLAGGLNPSFEMTFVKHSKTNDDGSLQEWRTLESIVVNDQIGDNKFLVFVDIVNYNYYHTLDDIAKTFTLPMGWGCRRNSEFKSTIGVSDDFQLEPGLNNVAHELTYEATLEMFNDEQSEGRKISPPISGTYYKGDWPELSVGGHEARIKYPNGNTLATKTVFDASKNLVYRINRISGFCGISMEANTNWVLEFPFGQNPQSSAEQPRELIQLTNQLFADLFLHTREVTYSIVNKYTMADEETLVTSYERKVDNLRLSERLEGPATIVRKFQATGGKYRSLLGGNQYKSHKSIWVQVLMFNADRSKLTGQLDISMQAPRVDLSEFLGQTNVVQCFNDGDPNWDRQLASFTMEYPLDLESKKFAYQKQPAIRDRFYEMLIATAGLAPLQLDGKARFEFTSHDEILRVHFNVLEAPPAHIYFNEVAESSIIEVRQEIAESRLVPAVIECSRWCEQLNCITMTYCDATKVCQIIREDAIDSDDLLRDQNKYLNWVIKSEPNKLCTYYYRKSIKPPMNLERFTRLMDKQINAPQMKSDENETKKKPSGGGRHVFAIYIRNDYVNPMRFTEAKEKFRWQHEDRDEPSEVFDLSQLVDGSNQGKSTGRMVFGTLKHSSRLDVNKLSEINRLENTNYMSMVSEVTGQDQCVEQCARYKCILLNYDRRTKECVLISMGNEDQAKRIHDIDHLSKLKQLIVPSGPKSSVEILDFLGKFSKFPTTMAPMDYELKLDGVGPMECALMCEYGREKCLSFDHCSVLNENLNEASSSSYCYLQKTHLTLGTFDKSKLLLPTNQANTKANRNQERQVNCDHYSKSVLEDFQKLTNRKLATRMNVATRGVNADNCAIDCLEDEDCRAFEYCYNDYLKPAQTCYFVRQRDILKEIEEMDMDEAGQVDVEKFGKQLKESKKCSVYVPRRLVDETKLSHSYHSLATLQSISDKPTSAKGLVQSLPVILFYLLAAILAGAVVQFAYIKLMGRPVELFSNFN